MSTSCGLRLADVMGQGSLSHHYSSSKFPLRKGRPQETWQICFLNILEKCISAEKEMDCDSYGSLKWLTF